MMNGAYDGLLMLLSVVWVVPIGVFIGMTFGAVPGLNKSGMLAILLPVLLAMPPEMGLVFAMSLYAGGEVGNAFPAVVLNIPGDASAAVTALEGYQMTLRGDGAKALGMCVMGSTIGAVLGGLASLVAAPTLGAVALRFSYPEICIIVLFGLAAIAQVSSGGLAKGLMMGFAGMLLSTTGTDPMWGTFRGTFGSIYLFDGLPIIPCLIGLLGFSELLKMIEGGITVNRVSQAREVGLKGVINGMRDTFRYPFDLLRSSLTGIIIGIVPGAGGTVSTFLSYQQALSWASPEAKKQFGKGSPNGLIAGDTANNADVGGSIVPLITLGIPGSSAAAVLLVIMAYHGLEVGPRLLSTAEGASVAYAIIWSQFVSAGLLVVMGGLLATFAYRLAFLPVNTMVPVIMVAALIGSFSQNQYIFDMGVMVVFGIIGFFMKSYGYPPIALLLGIILGPMFEENLLRTLRLGGGTPELFFERPLTLFLWFLLFLTLGARPALQLLRNYRNRRIGDPVKAQQ